MKLSKFLSGIHFQNFQQFVKTGRSVFVLKLPINADEHQEAKLVQARVLERRVQRLNTPNSSGITAPGSKSRNRFEPSLVFNVPTLLFCPGEAGFVENSVSNGEHGDVGLDGAIEELVELAELFVLERVVDRHWVDDRVAKQDQLGPEVQVVKVAQQEQADGRQEAEKKSRNSGRSDEDQFRFRRFIIPAKS